MGKIVICGDSFSIGLGCNDLTTEPWGPLLSKALGKEVINLAKGSSTNYSISLQADYAIEHIDSIDLLIISDTCTHRVDFFKENEHLRRSSDLWGPHPISNLDVNYHEYPPYSPGTYHQVLDHPYKDNPNYKGTLNTENWHGVIEYNNLLDSKQIPTDYFKKFEEDNSRLRLLREYYLKLFDINIQRSQDIGCLIMSYLRAKKLNIPVLLAMEKLEIKNVVDEKDFVLLDWGELANDYPDDLGTMHTSPEGHKIASKKVLEHIFRYNLINTI